jgi:hypothetical protein
MPLPTFVIGGPPKAGTTALWALLARHPQVFMTQTKEPRFFTRNAENPAPGITAPRMSPGQGYARGIDWYAELFEGSEAYPARGEASPQYIGALDGPELMQRHVPDLKVIFILRNPIARAYSHYWHHRARGRERGDYRADMPPFEAALNDDATLRYFIYFGRYRQHVERYRQALGPDRVHVILFDDLRAKPAETYAEVCRAIGVDDAFRPSFDREYNRSGAPVIGPMQRATAWTKDVRWSFLPKSIRRRGHVVRDRIEQWNRRTSSHPPLEPAAFERFVQLYDDDIAYVEGLLSRPLPSWRTSST